jgi:hypothetical protein
MARNHLVLVFSILSIVSPLAAAGTSGVIQPASTSLGPLQQQQFTLAGYGNNITWSVQPAGMGNITSSGFYTAFATAGVAYIYAKPSGSSSLFVSTVYQSLTGATGAPSTGAGPSWGTPPSSPAPGTPAPGTPAPPGPTWGSSPSAPSSGPTWGPRPRVQLLEVQLEAPARINPVRAHRHSPLAAAQLAAAQLAYHSRSVLLR